MIIVGAKTEFINYGAAAMREIIVNASAPDHSKFINAAQGASLEFASKMQPISLGSTCSIWNDLIDDTLGSEHPRNRPAKLTPGKYGF